MLARGTTLPHGLWKGNGAGLSIVEQLSAPLTLNYGARTDSCSSNGKTDHNCLTSSAPAKMWRVLPTSPANIAK